VDNDLEGCVWTYRYHNGDFKILSFWVFDDSVPSFNIIDEEYNIAPSPYGITDSNGTHYILIPGKTW